MQDLHNLFLDLSYTIYFYLITILNFNIFFPFPGCRADYTTHTALLVVSELFRRSSAGRSGWKWSGRIRLYKLELSTMWIPYLNLVIFLLM